MYLLGYQALSRGERIWISVIMQEDQGELVRSGLWRVASVPA